MTDSTVGGFCHTLAAGGDRVTLFLGFDESIGSAGEFRFEICSEFKKIEAFLVDDS